MREHGRIRGSPKEGGCPVAWKLGLKRGVRVGGIPSHDGAVAIGKEAPVVRNEHKSNIAIVRIYGAKELPLRQAPLPDLLILAECRERLAVSCDQEVINF